MSAAAEPSPRCKLRVIYAHHRADLAAALQANPTGNTTICAVLGHLQADGVAQVMGFVPLHGVVHTLRATNPAMRLDCELRMRCVGDQREMSRVRCSNGVLAFQLHALERRSGRRQHALTTWWASRCGLPWALRVNNTRDDVVALLTPPLRSRVCALQFEVVVEPRCWRRRSAQGERGCDCLLCSLDSFPQLRELSVTCAGDVNLDRAAADFTAALRATTQLPVSVLRLHSLRVLSNLAALHAATCLTSLTAINCGLNSLDGLEGCSRLTSVDVSRNAHLTCLAPLACLPRLTSVKASMCGLTSLHGVHACQALRDLSVCDNTTLKDVRGAAGAPCLERLDASECRLDSVAGLHRCPQLRSVDVSYNGGLQSLQGLAEAPHLTSIVARRCGLQDVGNLASCPELRSVDLSWNVYFADLSGLVGTTSVREVKLYGCSVTDAKLLGPHVQLRGVSDDDEVEDYDSRASDS